MGAGIDYGRGTTNIDAKTGIRYGVISQHSISGDALNDLEPVFPESEDAEDEDEMLDEEAIGLQYDAEGYLIVDCLDTDLMILKSPFYTFAKFCSPCVPGAGNLDEPDETGVKTYCLGKDWFEDDNAPYPIFEVEPSGQ